MFMNLADVTARVQQGLSGGLGFDKTVKFDFGDTGKLFIDGPGAKATNEDAPADATVSVGFDDFQKLVQGQLDPMSAFMGGKIKVAGDMGVVMKLQSLLGKLR
jgi:putative sterol carrier protein